MNPTLMRAVAECIVFLNLSSDDEVDPDVAVEQLEQLASIMQQLTANERAEFADFTQKLATEEAQSSRPSKERVECLRTMFENLGLV